MRGGRKDKLTEEVQEIILQAILVGATYKDASEAAGIHYDTFNRWMHKGEALKMVGKIE